jgi:TatD DNase family protein
VIDTHCHLDVAAFDEDREPVIARAGAAGVIGMLIPGIRPRTWAALGELARRHAAAGVRFAVGVHPQIVPELGEDERGGDLEERIARASEDAVAIGECGLDGGTGERVLQERIFRAHVRVARALGKPLVVHVLRAHDAAPRILREERAAECGVVLHSYSGGAALVAVYAGLGCAFSFAGPVTYPNARRPIEAARAVPAELLLAETDAPDQAPATYRGTRPASGEAASSRQEARSATRSEPAYLPAVIAGLGAARGAEPAEVAALTAANAARLFRTWSRAILPR